MSIILYVIETSNFYSTGDYDNKRELFFFYGQNEKNEYWIADEVYAT